MDMVNDMRLEIITASNFPDLQYAVNKFFISHDHIKIHPSTNFANCEDYLIAYILYDNKPKGGIKWVKNYGTKSAKQILNI